MDVDIRRDGMRYTLHFAHGENEGGLQKEPYKKKDTGTRIRWKPDIQVFTDIDVPVEYYLDSIKRQAIVNQGVRFVFRNQLEDGSFETTEFCYENGIVDHAKELAGDDALTSVQFWQAEKRVRDRADKPEYKTKINVAVAFSNKVHVTEYYHNSSWLEYGGAPDKAVRKMCIRDRHIAYQGFANRHAAAALQNASIKLLQFFFTESISCPLLPQQAGQSIEYRSFWRCLQHRNVISKGCFGRLK